MFEAAGWQVVTLKWGRLISALFEPPRRRRAASTAGADAQRGVPADAARRAPRGARPAARRGLLGRAARAARLGGHRRSSSPPSATSAGTTSGCCVDTFASIDDHRPTVVFAYTVKGRGLPTEGHPNNHSALLTEAQMRRLADACGTNLDDPWAASRPTAGPASCAPRRGEELRRTPVGADGSGPRSRPRSGTRTARPISTQAALGRLLADLVRDAPEAAARVVTCSPDVASSTNLGGWINKTGVWSVDERRDWFADDAERVLRWSESQQRPAHRARHRRGQPGGPARRAGGDLVAAGASG